MRRHIYLGVTDARLTWLKSKRVVYDIVEFYGHRFHIKKVASVAIYTVIEVTNVDIKTPMKRLYRYLKRNNFSGVIGPYTLIQLADKYPSFVNRHLTDGSYDLDGNWTPGPNLCPKRQIAGDPLPTIQATFNYDPTDEEILIDEIPGELDDPPEDEV